jgi:hypothetical protein
MFCKPLLAKSTQKLSLDFQVAVYVGLAVFELPYYIHNYKLMRRVMWCKEYKFHAAATKQVKQTIQLRWSCNTDIISGNKNRQRTGAWGLRVSFVNDSRIRWEIQV